MDELMELMAFIEEEEEEEEDEEEEDEEEEEEEEEEDGEVSQSGLEEGDSEEWLDEGDEEERIQRHLGSRQSLSPTATVGVDVCRSPWRTLVVTRRLSPRKNHSPVPTPVARCGQRHGEREAC